MPNPTTKKLSLKDRKKVEKTKKKEQHEAAAHKNKGQKRTTKPLVTEVADAKVPKATEVAALEQKIIVSDIVAEQKSTYPAENHPLQEHSLGKKAEVVAEEVLVDEVAVNKGKLKELECTVSVSVAVAVAAHCHTAAITNMAPTHAVQEPLEKLPSPAPKSKELKPSLKLYSRDDLDLPAKGQEFTELHFGTSGIFKPRSIEINFHEVNQTFAVYGKHWSCDPEKLEAFAAKFGVAADKLYLPDLADIDMTFEQIMSLDIANLAFDNMDDTMIAPMCDWKQEAVVLLEHVADPEAAGWTDWPQFTFQQIIDSAQGKHVYAASARSCASTARTLESVEAEIMSTAATTPATTPPPTGNSYSEASNKAKIAAPKLVGNNGDAVTSLPKPATPSDDPAIPNPDKLVSPTCVEKLLAMRQMETQCFVHHIEALRYALMPKPFDWNAPVQCDYPGVPNFVPRHFLEVQFAAALEALYREQAYCHSLAREHGLAPPDGWQPQDCY